MARNADFLRRIHRLAEYNERKIMTPGELRKLLKLEDGSRQYGSVC